MRTSIGHAKISLLKIKTKFSFQPTHNFGAPCSASSANNAFMNNCGYRGAFTMLNFLYNGLTLPLDSAGNLANLLTFDQAEFFALDPILSSMARSGFVYVPTACQTGARCRLHISFHGCMQSRYIYIMSTALYFASGSCYTQIL